jgi:hypothetical protein
MQDAFPKVENLEKALCDALQEWKNYQLDQMTFDSIASNSGLKYQNN